MLRTAGADRSTGNSITGLLSLGDISAAQKTASWKWPPREVRGRFLITRVILWEQSRNELTNYSTKILFSSNPVEFRWRHFLTANKNCYAEGDSLVAFYFFSFLAFERLIQSLWRSDGDILQRPIKADIPRATLQETIHFYSRLWPPLLGLPVYKSPLVVRSAYFLAVLVFTCSRASRKSVHAWSSPMLT